MAGDTVDQSSKQLDYYNRSNLALSTSQLMHETGGMFEFAIVVIAFIVLDIAAIRWGHDSRELLRPRGGRAL